jgi:DNA-directed RNA polymerase subunit RPC12/RpoP
MLNFNYIKIPIIFGQISSLINNLLFSKRNQFNRKIELEILLLEPEEFIFNRTFEISKTEEIGVDSISLMKLNNDNDEILNLINHKKILVKPNENFTYFFNIPMEEIDSLLFFCEKDSPNIFYNNGEQEVYINNLKEELLQYKFINIPKFINENNDKEKYFKIKFKEDFFENRRNELVNRLVHFIWFKDVNPIIKNEINNYLKNKNSIEINFLKTDFLLEKIKYEDKCAISFEEFEDKDKVQVCITCSHAFKFEAIQKWKKVLQDKNEKITCPYCRSNLGDKYYQIIK